MLFRHLDTKRVIICFYTVYFSNIACGESTIDINNIDLSIKTIETIIKNNEYEKSKHYIKLERKKMFNEYSIFHEFSTVLDTVKTTEEDKKIINIYTESDLKSIRTKIIKIFTTIKNYKFPTTQTFI